LSTAINYVSDQQVQNTYRVSILESKERLKTCENLEEKEGRINCDLLNRFVLIGAPFVPAGPDMQAHLVSQVLNISLLSLLPLALEKTGNKYKNDTVIIILKRTLLISYRFHRKFQ
jgi:hypothetical protein